MNTKMQKFSDLAKRIDEQYVRLINEGMNEPQLIFNRMMAFLPELHELWTNTSDYELAALSNKYPNFMNFCKIMEQLSVAQNQKESRPYDGEQKFDEEQRKVMQTILADIAQIHEAALKLKQFDGTDASSLTGLKNSLVRWMERATAFKGQLSQDGASNYAIKTVDAVFIENYKQASELLDTIG